MKASTKKTLWILAIIAILGMGVYHFTMKNSGNTSNADGHGTRGSRKGYRVYNSPESAMIVENY